MVYKKQQTACSCQEPYKFDLYRMIIWATHFYSDAGIIHRPWKLLWLVLEYGMKLKDRYRSCWQINMDRSERYKNIMVHRRVVPGLVQGLFLSWYILLLNYTRLQVLVLICCPIWYLCITCQGPPQSRGDKVLWVISSVPFIPTFSKFQQKTCCKVLYEKWIWPALPCEKVVICI